jgi:hypothetical protein
MASGTVAGATVAIARQSALGVSLPQSYADFLSDARRVFMIRGIWSLRSFGLLPSSALSRNVNSIRSSDIPADLKEVA